MGAFGTKDIQCPPKVWRQSYITVLFDVVIAHILKAIKNATLYKAVSMQKVYMILEAMAISQGFLTSTLVISIQKIAI